MTDALKEAAEAASAATGLDVQILEEWEHLAPGKYLLEAYAPIDSDDGQGPVLYETFLTEAETLALLRGLEAGARIATVRHEALGNAANDALLNVVYDEASGRWMLGRKECDALSEALAELES